MPEHKRIPLIDRLLANCMPVTESGCLIWMGPLNHAGYGTIAGGGWYGPTKRVHRASYEIFVGPIPEGKEIDHLCRVRCCINPHHLEPVTHGENMRRGSDFWPVNQACPKGHDYEGNEYTPKDGRRRCKECRRLAVNRSRANRRNHCPVPTYGP